MLIRGEPIAHDRREADKRLLGHRYAIIQAAHHFAINQAQDVGPNGDKDCLLIRRHFAAPQKRPTSLATFHSRW